MDFRSGLRALQHLLGFMSDDEIRFKFVAAESPPALSRHLDFKIRDSRVSA